MQSDHGKSPGQSGHEAGNPDISGNVCDDHIGPVFFCDGHQFAKENGVQVACDPKSTGWQSERLGLLEENGFRPCNNQRVMSPPGKMSGHVEHPRFASSHEFQGIEQ
jgi:hypothetical protein